MPRLYIDGSAISLQNKGVGRYSYELCRRVVDQLDKNWEIDIVVYADKLPSLLKQKRGVTYIKTSKMSDLYHNLIWLPRQIRRRHYDVLLKPMESTGIRYGVSTITICHDVQELIDAAAGIRQALHRKLVNFVKRAFKSKNLRESAVVVSNSMFTRDAAAFWYKFDIAKSVIGYCGVNERFFYRSIEFSSGKRKKHFSLNNFILTFATGDSRENYELLPEILFNIRKNGCDAKLVVAGIQKGSNCAELLEAKFIKLKLHPEIDFQFIEFLGENRIDDLIELYTTADFYLELSGHEGFGMQLAEAMACGTTCISSGAGALTEIGAGFDIRFHSLDVDQIAKTIVNCYYDELHRRRNSNQVEYVRTHYTWDAVAGLVVRNIISLNP